MKDTALHNPLIGIVDDDASVRISARWLVNALGCQTEIFSSAREF
jgi:FixJ family two-component response regulator